MKLFRFLLRKDSKHRHGFSLVESALSLSFLSIGFLSLIPLLSLGLKTARQSRNTHDTAQIAQTLIEEAKQGVLTSGTFSLDAEGNSCSTAQAAYTAQASFLPVTDGPGGASGLVRVTLQVTPVGAPNGARIYAVLLPASP